MEDVEDDPPVELPAEVRVENMSKPDVIVTDENGNQRGDGGGLSSPGEKKRPPW